MKTITKKPDEVSRRQSESHAVLWLACLFCALSLSSLFGMASKTTSSDPKVEHQPSNWEMQAHSDNPFVGKVFVSEAKVTPFFASFRFWAFNTESSATVGKESLRREDIEGLRDRNEKQSAYKVDARRKILILDNAEYIYEFKNSKTVELKQLMESFTVYEVPSSPQVFFKSNIFLDNKGFADPGMKDPMMNMRLRMLNRYIAAAKADTDALPEDPTEPQQETPKPPEDPPPPPPNPVTNITVINQGQNVAVQNEPDKKGEISGEEKKDDPRQGNPAEQLTVDDLVNGQYQGSFVNETKGTTSKFHLKIVPLSEPEGNPPKARISGVINFEDGRSDKGLQGEAVYAQSTTFTLGWTNSTGTVAYSGTLVGDNLRGSWRMDGAQGEKSNGTFETVRTGP